MSRYLVWLLGGGSVLAAVAVAGYFGLNLRDDPAPVVVTPRESAPTAAPVAANDPGPIGTEPVVEEAEAAVPMPTFDVVRVARDGAALVAGSATPGAAVTLSVDGVVVAEVAADANGQYVALFELGASDEAQSMTLSMRDADGTVLTAEDTVILTPRPEQLAALDVPEAANVDAAPVADAEAPEVEETQAEADVAEVDALAEEAEAATTDAQPADVDVTGTASTDAEVSVETPGPTAFLLRGDGQVERLDTAPGVANVVVDTIAYTAEGAVQIAGRAAEGASAALRLYLDNDFLAETRADAGEWSLDLPEVAPGVYTLRVDQLDDAGRVVSRFETPFLREAPERVAEAQAAMAAATPVTETAAAAEAVMEPAPEAESPVEDVAVVEEAAEDAPIEIAALDLPEETAGSTSTEVSLAMSEATEVMEDPAVVTATEATDEAATIEAAETEAAEDVMASQAEESEASAEAPASDAPANPPVVASAPATGEFAETEEAVSEDVVVEDAAELPSATQTETTPRETESEADTGEANPVASVPTPERVVSEAAASVEQNAGNTAPVSAEMPMQSAEVPVTESASTTTQTEQANVATATSESSAVGESSSAPAAPTTAEASASAAASASTSSSSTGSSAGTSPSQTSSASASSGAVAEGASAAQSMEASSSQSGTSATTTSSASGVSSSATQPATSSASASGSSTQASASSASSSAGTASSTAPAAPRVSLITVQPGHTLWHISRERYGQGEQYVIIYNANRSQIRDPDLIYPGQIFTLPDR
ncbi:LysM peptidoglycan-binding domain-containing protein [Cereibacter sphaeroides]|nr:LysM peptidoglycan-binding domain-containing protein [Cereibacter sphaeroides]